MSQGIRLGALAVLLIAATPGFARAEGPAVLRLSGDSEAARIAVSIDPDSGELVLSDPAGIEPPGAPCTPPPEAATTEIRCPADAIGAIVGNLGEGNDRLTVASDVPVRIGARVSGRLRGLHGGPGADQLYGGAAGDALFGDAGGDRLLARGGADLLRGGLGADRLLAGPGADALFGAAGADRLNGGAGRDFCNGGAGPDGLRSCALGS
jgi:RTX calcium-binding nonapeptide repeat (4 copies)